MRRLTKRFIIKSLNGLNLSAPLRYERYYIGKRIRVQKKGDQYQKELLDKQGNVIERINISESEFLLLKKQATAKILRDSFLYLDDDRVSIKKYYGDYDGLYRVEVKFHSEAEEAAYIKAAWMGEEITQSVLAFDSNLIKLSPEEFQHEIQKNLGSAQDRKFDMSNGEVCYESPWARVLEYDTKTDGRTGKYTVIERQDTVIMILEHHRQGILFMKSYRFPIGKTSWELPMGGINAQETPAVAATRELKEEAGIDVALQQIGVFYPAPGLTPQCAFVFYGKATDNDLKRIIQYRQPVDEIIDRKFITHDEAKSMIHTQKIQDGFTLSALMRFGLAHKKL